jgi:CBS domain-containing protein
VHRVLICHDYSPHNIIGILSQSRVAEYIYSHVSNLSGPPNLRWTIGETSVSELDIIDTEIISVSPSDSVLNAMTKMHRHKISSVAIIKQGPRQENVVIGLISISDIKDIVCINGWHYLRMTSFDFFQHVRHEQAFDNGGDIKMPIFTCYSSSLLNTVIGKMIATRTHRIWVVDEKISIHHEVVGLISLSSIMKLLLK